MIVNVRKAAAARSGGAMRFFFRFRSTHRTHAETHSHSVNDCCVVPVWRVRLNTSATQPLSAVLRPHGRAPTMVDVRNLMTPMDEVRSASIFSLDGLRSDIRSQHSRPTNLLWLCENAG